MATHLGTDVVTDFSTHNLADAAADASPGARTVARPDRAALEDADDAALATTLINTFFNSNFRAVVATLASADDAAEPRAFRTTVNNTETDVFWRQSATLASADDAAVRRTHYFTFGGTDAQKNGKAHDSTDCVHQRQNRKQHRSHGHALWVLGRRRSL